MKDLTRANQAICNDLFSRDFALISIYITGHLKDYTANKNRLELPATKNVASLIEDLSKTFPGIKDKILDDQEKTRPFVNIFVNGVNIRDVEYESTILKEGDTVHILPSIAGG